MHYSYFQLIMKPMNKMQTLAPLEKDIGQMKDIYKMINQQEKYMEDLLSKYKHNSPNHTQNQKEPERSHIMQSKTLEPSYNQREDRSVFSRGHSSDRMEMVPLGLPRSKRISLDLPSISPRKHKKTNKPVKTLKSKTPRPQDPYFLDSKLPHQKDRMKQVLQKAYLQDRSLKQSKAESRLPPKNYTIEPPVEPLTKAEKQSRLIQELDLKPKEPSIPEPVGMGYFNNIQKDDSSSEEGEVPLTYYEREYRNLIRNQSVEETNFLYFSKNESMQGWTQGLLFLFQKHDKQLAALRKRCKYLEKFDANFFSIDIFCND